MNSSEWANKVLIFGIPAAVAMCGWGLTEIVSSGRKIERMLAVVEGIQGKMNEQDQRIDRLEDGYFREHN